MGRVRDALFHSGPIPIIALVGTIVLTLVQFAAVLYFEPVFLKLFADMGAQLPLLTALTIGVPLLARVLEVLVVGPGLFALLVWRLKGKPSPWLFAPMILLYVLIPLEVFALYAPLSNVVTVIR